MSGERPRTLEISDNDLWILSYYRESELAGALIMGRLARETDDDELRVHLTAHCAEEANHAWLWTRTILDVGGTPQRVSETYQSRYYAEIGQPTTMLEVLALTQVFEKRVLSHFREHLGWPNTHPAVVRTLERMIAEETGHIHWVAEHLDRFAREHDAEEEVAETLRRFAEVDRKVYAGVIDYRERFRELVDRAGETAEEGRAVGEGISGRSVDQVEPEVRRIVARSLGVEESALDARAPLESLGLDSLDLVAAISRIEEAFRIEFSPEDTERLTMLDDLVDKVVELVAAARG